MKSLDIATILFAGLLTGNELAVSLFVNPAIWKLDDHAQAKELARSLGRIMPFWYALCLLMLGAVAFLHRHDPGRILLIIAVGVWFATVPYSIAALVPINNRIAKGASSEPGWREQHRRWDTLHRWRIALLIVAMICLLLGLSA